jgi:signal transduction histidine kinase
MSLSKEYNIFIYRIVSELLANIIKHAKAQLITINIDKGENFYYITVQDDGIGFDTKKERKATKQGGFGLLSIIERLDNIKGKFNLESKLGEGTKATIKVPYSADK